MKVRSFICALLGCKKQTVNTDAVSRSIRSVATDVDFANKRAISSMIDNLVTNAVNTGANELVATRARELKERSGAKRQTLHDTIHVVISDLHK